MVASPGTLEKQRVGWLLEYVRRTEHWSQFRHIECFILLLVYTIQYDMPIYIAHIKCARSRTPETEVANCSLSL